MEEIKVVITKTKEETPYMVEVYINGEWFKELGPFADPQLALEQTAKNDDLKEYMRPDLLKKPNPTP